MPVTMQDLEEQRKRMRQAGAATALSAGVPGDFMGQVQAELRKRAEARSVSKLTEAAGAARKEFVAAPPRLREEYQDIDPFRRMTLIGERRGDIMSELDEIAALRGQREAGIADVIGGVRSGLEAEAARMAAQYGVESDIYRGMFGEAELTLEQEQNQIENALAAADLNARTKYQEAQVALGQGELELAGEKLNEAKRAALVGEQLESRRLDIMAMQARKAGGAPTVPFEIGGEELQLDPEWVASYLADQESRAYEVAANAQALTQQNAPRSEVEAYIRSMGFDPNGEPFASVIGQYQPTRSLWENIGSALQAPLSTLRQWLGR